MLIKPPWAFGSLPSGSKSFNEPVGTESTKIVSVSSAAAAKVPNLANSPACEDENSLSPLMIPWNAAEDDWNLYPVAAAFVDVEAKFDEVVSIE